MSSLCPKCNQPVAENNKFCINCGTENPNFNPNATKKVGLESFENLMSQKASQRGYEQPMTNGYYTPRFTGYYIRLIFAAIFVILFFFGISSAKEARIDTEKEMYIFFTLFMALAAIRIYVSALIDKRKSEQESKFMNDMHDSMQKLTNK